MLDGDQSSKNQKIRIIFFLCACIIIGGGLFLYKRHSDRSLEALKQKHALQTMAPQEAGESQQGTSATGGDGTAAGQESATGEDGTAAGQESATGEDGTAAGQESATGEDGTVAGQESATGEDGSATGQESDVMADGNTAGSLADAQPEIAFRPHCVKSTAPKRLIRWTQIQRGGKLLKYGAGYRRRKKISFSTGDRYTGLEGVMTFRGNNFRSNPVYGTADITKKKIKTVWTKKTGYTMYEGHKWTGSGWTGQPLMRKWSRQEKAAMKMAKWAKEDDDLVEVIYACLDGNVYFFDLKTGKNTRAPLHIGWTFKGAGALDPRGYPLLYLGAGYNSSRGCAKAFIISLVDQRILYTFGEKDPFSMRGSLSFFDSSPLVDAETDTLIWPGENGILYLMRLHSSYNEKKGRVSIRIRQRDVIKWRYQGVRSSTSSYWLGMEDSCAIYKGFLFVTDNGGNLMCLNLNTLKLVWVADTLDDSNSSPVLNIENGHLYLYVSTSFHLGWRSRSTASIPIWKFDAETGKKLWQKSYTCRTKDGVSGGVQSTIAVGRQSLKNRIYVTVAMTDQSLGGILACLDTRTGKVLWEHKSAYTWSSPVCVYGADQKGYVIYCNSVGKIFLLNGRTGKELYCLQFSPGNVEASPAVYDDMLVVGTRSCQICGLKLK